MSENWYTNCEAELQNALNSALNPIALGVDIRNPNKAAPDVQQVPLAIQLGIAYNGVWEEHREYVETTQQGSSIRWRDPANFQIGTLSFTLMDYADVSILPYNPCVVPGQKVRLRNANGTDTYFKGEVESQPKRMAFSQAQSSNRDLARFQVNCVSEMVLFRRVPIREVIIGPTTEGAMIADLCSRYVPELDLSGINLDFGQPVERATIDGQYLFQVIQNVLKNNPDGAFFLDINQDPSRIYLDTRDALAIKLPLTLTDANLYSYGPPGFWDVRKTQKSYRNRVIVRCPKLYNVGTADVDFDNEIVYGTDTAAFGGAVPGSRFRVAGSESTYTLAKNLSAGFTPPYDGELYLQGKYQGDTATGVQYEIIGSDEDQLEVIAEDAAEIERMRVLTGEIGDNAGVREIIIVERTPLTEYEAQRLADLSLQLESWEGAIRTNNFFFPLAGLRAGRTLEHNMPLRDVVATLPIQNIEAQIVPGPIEPRGGREDPLINYVLDFTNREQGTESYFRDLLLANRRIRLSDSGTVRITKSIIERYAVGACVAWTYGETVENNFEMELQLQADYPDDATMYATRYPRELGTGQLALDPMGDDPASLWFPT